MIDAAICNGDWVVVTDAWYFKEGEAERWEAARFGEFRVLPDGRALLVGMADAIVDLVSTGNTLKANHLVEVEHIMDISSRLVVNQAALKLKQAPIRAIIDAFESAIGK